nr:DUF3343 domain-containing protein [uncultured Niameybacter sp.]
MEYIATFFTHFGAIQFGRKLSRQNISYRMMPVPRMISSSCGSCIRFEGELLAGIEEDEEIEGLYRVVEDKYELILQHN